MIEIVFEHRDFIVINKPPFIAVQNEVDQSGILPLVCEQLGVAKLWLVHRLDKVTSGLLILAKSEQAAAEFGRLFEAHLVQKYYLAISNKKPKKKQGTVSGGMKKVRDGLWILDSSQTQRATTQFFSYGITTGLRLFVLKPLTGKTHQIRVMMKSLGSPILGDELYKADCADRTYLHAYALKFNYQQQEIELVCSPQTGEAFNDATTQNLLASLTKPWDLVWPAHKLPR
ncbi:TIGR01621 family pseudouridine synthase [Paraglaciecola hydrolytica]|uniref:TIGR01621 family pseudouridine synthase n=1 Tax=Paraglaciecola hydrolytica TaxID=1799789 RepID=UPI000A9B564C